jgi:hypothetical protein
MKSVAKPPVREKPRAAGPAIASDRVARRIPAAEILDGGDVRLAPGGPVELVNISETGALVESRHRTAVGAAVALCIGGDQPRRLPARVVRSQVCAINTDSTMKYQLGLAFDKPTTIATIAELSAESAESNESVESNEDEPANPAVPPPPQPVEPVNEW